MPDATIIAAWIGVLVAAGGVVAGSAKFLFWVWDELSKRKTREGFSMPRDTLRLATKPSGNCRWHMGKHGDDPTMQVVGSVFVTNIANVPVRCPQVELRYGFIGRHRVSGMVMVANGQSNRTYGMYDIPPNETRDLTFNFWVFPPTVKANQNFTANSVTITDQFGNRHTLKRLEFQSTNSDAQSRPKEPEEFPYSIVDPIEKEVVSVLKAERARYALCGRSAGGLGSVHIVYRGHAFTGVGGDAWETNSPRDQMVVTDPETAVLQSDNLNALLALYARLGSEVVQTKFKDVLLDRLDARKGYIDVSYFIFVVLWRVGAIDGALSKSRQALPTGDMKSYGLSNILLVLNGLLKYRHPDFTGDTLDKIESMLHGLDEHQFMISAKIASIRTSRLSTPSESKGSM